MTEPHVVNAGGSVGRAKLLFTLDEASEALRVSRSQVYALINERRLPTVYIGRRRFVTPDDLTTFIKKLQEGGDNARQAS